MSLSSLCWHNHTKLFPKDAHAIFGASKYTWLNYSDEKMIETYTNNQAKKIGTRLHEIACGLIENKIPLPDEIKTLNMYVNDAIYFDLKPEVQLYYSPLFFGTADSIGIVDNVLHIHDLKTGKTKAKIDQLMIYAAFFFLDYEEYQISDFDKIELRIYQNNEIVINNPESDDILLIMDKIMRVNDIIMKMQE